jgi:hypothetical protein
MGGLCLDPVDCKTEEVDTDGLPCFFVKNFVAELGTCTGKVSFSIIFEDRNNSQSYFLPIALAWKWQELCVAESVAHICAQH